MIGKRTVSRRELGNSPDFGPCNSGLSRWRLWRNMELRHCAITDGRNIAEICECCLNNCIARKYFNRFIIPVNWIETVSWLCLVPDSRVRLSGAGRDAGPAGDVATSWIRPTRTRTLTLDIKSQPSGDTSFRFFQLQKLSYGYFDFPAIPSI